MTRTLLTALMALTVAPAAHSATPEPRPGVEFEHNDWSLACDNTRTPRRRLQSGRTRQPAQPDA